MEEIRITLLFQSPEKFSAVSLGRVLSWIDYVALEWDQSDVESFAESLGVSPESRDRALRFSLRNHNRLKLVSARNGSVILELALTGTVAIVLNKVVVDGVIEAIKATKIRKRAIERLTTMIDELADGVLKVKQSDSATHMIIVDVLPPIRQQLDGEQTPQNLEHNPGTVLDIEISDAALRKASPAHRKHQATV